GDRTAAGPVRQWLRPTIFRRPFGPFHREAKSPVFAILRCRSGPCRFTLGCRPGAPAVFQRHEGCGGRGQPPKGASR
ncbi:unnamed protein product, partial [Scytosiphon promiscuus]